MLVNTLTVVTGADGKMLETRVNGKKVYLSQVGIMTDADGTYIDFHIDNVTPKPIQKAINNGKGWAFIITPELGDKSA